MSYSEAVGRLRRLADPIGLEREGIDACEALGVPGWNAAWTAANWDSWHENLRAAIANVCSGALDEFASRSGE